MPKTARVERRDNVSAFPRGAQLVTFVNQGGNFFELPIQIDLIFGEEHVSDETGFGFSLRFRKCFLRLKLDRCQIINSTPRYQTTLPPEDFVQLVKRTIQKSRDASGKIGASVDGLLSKVLSSVGLEGALGGSIEKTMQNLEMDEYKSTIKYRIVEPTAGDSWRIGHEVLGDPRTLDQTLSGQYFRDKSDNTKEEAEDATALCAVGPDSELQKTYEVGVMISCTFKDGVYLPIVENEDADLMPNSLDWRSSNRLKIEKLMMLKAIRDDQIKNGWDVHEGELIISHAKIKVRISDAEQDNMRENL
ncbi:hypothetical protein [Yoonia sp. R2-816]|uniref:hypothetical protein n=1 Tax=Yoonia sp. R2-816 TaxID=3342638 RepID=UPI0037268F97